MMIDMDALKFCVHEVHGGGTCFVFLWVAYCRAHTAVTASQTASG